MGFVAPDNVGEVFALSSGSCSDLRLDDAYEIVVELLSSLPNTCSLRLLRRDGVRIEGCKQSGVLSTGLCVAASFSVCNSSKY